jgi:hypothetical protein
MFDLILPIQIPIQELHCDVNIVTGSIELLHRSLNGFSERYFMAQRNGCLFSRRHTAGSRAGGTDQARGAHCGQTQKRPS